MVLLKLTKAEIDEIIKQKERDGTNEENTQSYNTAHDRRERIDAALRLLNRGKP